MKYALHMVLKDEMYKECLFEQTCLKKWGTVEETLMLYGQCYLFEQHTDRQQETMQSLSLFWLFLTDI